MLAIQYHRWGSSDELHLEETAVPVPGPHQVLVRVAYASLNPIDYKIRNGRFRYFMNRSFSKIPGLEASGRVEVVGNAVQHIQTGDFVFVLTSGKFKMGCCAEYVVADAAFVFRLPEGFDLKTGSALSVAPATALQALRVHGKVTTGSKVLINGASGSVGQCAVQIASILGAEVTAVCSGRNTELVQNLGASRVIDYTQTDFTTLPDQYDVVLDTVSSRSFQQCRRVLTPKGRYINLMLRPMDLIFQKINNLISSQQFITFVMQYNTSDLQWLVEHLQSGKLYLPVDSVFPLRDTRMAFERLESSRALGKVLVKI